MSCSQHLQHTPDREISWQQAEIFPDPDSGISWTLSLLLAAETKCCAESKKPWQLSQAKVLALPLSVWLRKFMWDFTTEMSAFFNPQSLSIFFLLGSAALAARCYTRRVCWVLQERRGVASSQKWHVLLQELGGHRQQGRGSTPWSMRDQEGKFEGLIKINQCQTIPIGTQITALCRQQK